MTEQEQTAAAEANAPAEDIADGDTFDASYVKQLRAEAARHRKEAREAAGERDAARAEAAERTEELLVIKLDAAIRAASAGPHGLADAGDVLIYKDRADLLGEDGQPDPGKIKAAVTQLREARPHLRTRWGSADQGPRFDDTPPGPPSLGEVLGNVRAGR